MFKHAFVLFFLVCCGYTFAERAESPASPAKETHGEAGRPVADGERTLNPAFERYEGGTKESEAKLIRRLAAKFAQLQVAVGARMGRNERDTHANGFCLDGNFEVYDQQDDSLKIGPFKKKLAGEDRPKVRIRFADASSGRQPNHVPDVRSVSFSFEVDGKRQDFSMNNDPVFTFGNLTDFNNFMAFSLLTAGLPPETLKQVAGGLFAQNPDLAASVQKANKLGTFQKEKDVYGYHTENYGSGSAFKFGEGQAAKFNLVRCKDAEPVRQKLTDEEKAADQKAYETAMKTRTPYEGILVQRTRKAINGETVEDPNNDGRNDFCFELEVQLLDAANMKAPKNWTKAEPPTAADWVEDATLNWTEGGAKSYKLGKLTANPRSNKSAGECDKVSNGYDVNIHSFDELKPLGNINRARAYAEHQSQSLRAPNQPAAPYQPAKVENTKAIEQGWNDEDREIYWYTPQGSYIMPYDWFMALKDPKTKRPLRKSLEGMGFIQPDYKDGYQPNAKLNPDRLPIGITKESPPDAAFAHLQGKGDWLGITCAACHTGAVTEKGTKHIIDGAPSTVDFQKFSLTLEEALNSIRNDKKAFNQFQKKLAKKGVSVNLEDVNEVTKRFADRNTRSFFHGNDRKNPTANAGPGRTDAFGVILNEVTSRVMGLPQNANVASAPVSFPHVWGAPFEKWIQYSGLSNNAFSRNVGEVLGVFGDVVLDPKSPDFLKTTARFENLQLIEDKMRKLKAPQWEQVHGPFTPEERDQAKRGKEVYAGTCARCHNPESVTMVPAGEFGPDLKRNSDFAGTDPLYFVKLKKFWSNVDTGMLSGKNVLGLLKERDPEFGTMFKDIIDKAPLYKDKDNAVQILADTTMGLFLKYLKDNGIKMDPNDPKYQYLTGGALPEKQPHVGAYKARSLDGIAFTGPYFHNGSVRTLREVISPEERQADFQIGSTVIDKKNGGFENAGDYSFRANQFGNLNIGHDFGAHLTPGQKEDLLMYLKSL